MQVTPVATLPQRLTARGVEVAPGLLLCLAIAAVATAIGTPASIAGSAIPAVIIGVLIAVALLGMITTARDYRDGAERALARQNVANQLLIHAAHR